jgi:hypothetical protein
MAEAVGLLAARAGSAKPSRGRRGAKKTAKGRKAKASAPANA